MQIAELIAWGANRKEVPDILHRLYGGRNISPTTVNNILASVYSKLGINSETSLSAWYFCECHGVDRLLNPMRRAVHAAIASMLLLIMMPQLLSPSDAMRPQRTRSFRVVRANTRGRMKGNTLYI